MTEITTIDFRESIFDFKSQTPWKSKSTKPIILDFFADWCQPCKTIARTLAEVKKELKDVEFYKIDSEKEFELTEFFKIKNLPTLIFIPIEGEIKVITGNLTKNKIQEIIRETFKFEETIK